MSELFHPEFEEEPPNRELMGPAKIEKDNTATLLSAFRMPMAETQRTPGGYPMTLKKKKRE